MRNDEYWEQAALLREIAVQEGATHTAAEVLELYDGALKDIQNEIRTIKFNFKKRYGIDDKTAEYHLSRARLDDNMNTLIELLENAPDAAARKKILDYIHRDGLSVRAYSARIERYEQLKTVIYARTMKIAAESTGIIGDMLKSAYKESYYGLIDDAARGMDVGIGFTVLNDNAINEAVNAKWNGKRFSRRIWDNTDRLATEAQNLIVKSLISGESYTKTSRKLAEAFNVEKYHATTLIHTETAHIHGQADLKAYKDLGVQEYKYLATLDYRTCETCQPLDGKVFKLSAAREGVNYPTMHPRCRCTTTMNIDYASRRARNPLSGKNEIVDGDMTYSQWIDSLTPEEKAALELSRKKDDNKTSDKLQHAEYKATLGTKIVPRSFDKFQEMKYTDSEKWRYIKLDYGRQNRLAKHPELALPNASKVTADDRKFTGYLFNPENAEGWAKGKAFTSRLGYDKNNYADLKKEIVSHATKYPARLKGEDKFGKAYEQKIVLYGLKNKPANVIIGWKENNGETWMTSAYIKEVQ